MSDGDWIESSEGDLDPDLTEEAGYAYWDPPHRAWGAVLLRVIMAIVLIALLGSVVLAAVR